MKIKLLSFFILLTSISFGQTSLTIRLIPGEKIWSGSVKQSDKMPLESGYKFDFYANNEYNQIQPLLLGNKGLWVWSEEPFAFEIQTDRILITKNIGEVKHGRSGQTLADASRYASKEFFPPSGKMPDELLFSKPQYNTWIELTYNQNQTDVLKYAQAIIDNGFEPGVLMIDDTWQEDYGKWDFHPGRFPNQKAMVEHYTQPSFGVVCAIWASFPVKRISCLLENGWLAVGAVLARQTPSMERCTKTYSAHA